MTRQLSISLALFAVLSMPVQINCRDFGDGVDLVQVYAKEVSSSRKAGDLVRDIQNGTNYSNSSRRAADPCKCSTWTDVYEFTKVECGMGQEFTSGSDTRCNSFYKKLDDQICVNTGIGSDTVAMLQWCYVSSDCAPTYNKELGVFSPRPIKGTPSSVKICDSSDAQMKDLTPAEIANFAQLHKIPYKLAFQMSYPSDNCAEYSDTQEGHIWSCGTAAPSGKISKFPDAFQEKLQSKRKQYDPTSGLWRESDAPQQGPSDLGNTWAVTMKGTAYLVTCSDEVVEFDSEFASTCSLECVENCPDDSPKLA